MITDEMVKAAEDEGAMWCSGAKHDRRGSVWSVIRDDVVISEHPSDDEMSIALAKARTRAMLEAAERAAWLPIDTAPTDPRASFLVTGHRWGYPAKGRFYERACFFEGDFHGIDPETDEPCDATFDYLTHWRPEPTLEDFGEEA
jgi:hypothetical protein